MTVPYIMIIQSAYSDERLSERRLEISRHTSIVSLRYQTRKPTVHIVVNPDDPFVKERIEAFESTGCEVKPIYRPTWKLYKENWELPDGRKVVSRMDDDDVICKEFCDKTYISAPDSGECALIWPNGYVFWRETCFLLRHHGIQFVTIVTDRQTDPHQEQHWEYHRRWPSKIVSREVGWIWVRHGDAATSTIRKYRSKKLRGIDANRIPVNLRAILRAIAPSGKPSGNYAEHQSPAIAYVRRQNELNAVGNKLRILIAVTTCNLHGNQEIKSDLAKAVHSIRMNTASDILIVDDGSCSDHQQWVTDQAESLNLKCILRESNGGVSAAKNVCLQEFMNGQYDYCFLLDDDIEILSPQFESRYIDAMQQSGVGILSFNDPSYTATTPHGIGSLVATDHTCGCCVVVSRKCVEATGRYLELPGKWGSEHLEYYCRAARHGLTNGCDKFLDVENSVELISIASHASVYTAVQKRIMHHENLHVLLSDGLIWNCPPAETESFTQYQKMKPNA